ncbi:F-box/kelch-repeat protein At3g23880-like [Vicia villosa]|uniref:F-box/kelch-repeat protein At3g23880-like n=1 Tax=Vicia villosa TaxID=3911 RepID=UPI00273A7DEB|nr:F-box/kelch-repeat protein At3g23880-like [Vicia villosa]
MYRHQHENDTVLPVFTQPLSPNGGESCSHLPEELIIEILLRLPVKSLLQLKCICKLWKTLISNPQFVKQHLLISNAKPSLTHQRLFFSFMTDPRQLLSYPLKPLFQNLLPPVSSSGTMKYWIIGSCNGLLCLYGQSRHCFKLHNPSIMFKSKKSPSAASLDWISNQYGFGYDQVNDKYKVLLVVRNMNDPTQTLTKVYTFGDDSWKTIQNFHLTPIRPSGQFVSGTLNWIVKKRGAGSNQSMILSFDLEKETYKEILVPQDDADKVYGDTLYVLNNCLGVCYETNQTHWVAWLMKEYGVFDSWTKFITIPLDKFNKPLCFLIPLFISENCVVLLVNKYNSHFILFNLNSGELDYSWDYFIKSVFNFRRNLHICSESLVSL